MLKNNATNNKTQILRLGLFLIFLGVVCNQWILTAIFSSDGLLSVRNVLIIWAFDVIMIVVGLILVIFRSFSKLIDVLVGLFFTVLLLFGVEKFFYRLNHPANSNPGPPPPHVYHEGDYTHDFFLPDEWLGYKVRPDAAVTSIKKSDETVIYDVLYTLDPYHRRVTPVKNAEERSKYLLFFGDSFTFGEGLNDDETLPYYVAELATAYRPYNYGLSGYGPQQMLAQLQSPDILENITESEGAAIYVFIDAHVERAIGSMYVYNAWGDQMPFYTTDWSGNLIRKGNFTTGRPLLSTLYGLLAKSEVTKYYNLNIPGTLASSHYQHTARIVAAARDTFEAKFNSTDFYVVIYPDEGDYAEDIVPFFEQANLKVLNYDELMKLDPEQGLSIAGDGHPTGKANKIVAEKIVKDSGLDKR